MTFDTQTIGSNIVPIAPNLRVTFERTFNGPLSADLWSTVSELKSAYTDNFDWTVYDRIHARYKDNPPRGGVIFQTGLKLVNHHSSCSKCHYALEVDTYGRGCVHDCVFCYAKDQLSAHGYWNRPIPFPVNLAEIRKTFYTVFETNKESKWRSVLEKRIPLRIGSMSDSFMWMDQKYGVTKELLRILAFYNYPYVIFTRSDLVAEDSYLELLRKDLAAVQFSISGDNDLLIKTIEPGAPSVSRRLKAMSKLNAAGIWSSVRINPMFPSRPDGYFSNRESVVKGFGSEEKIPKFEIMTEEFLPKIRDAGAKTFLAGFVRLSPWAIKNISDAADINFKEFFSLEVIRNPGDKHYSLSEISYYYKELKEKAVKNQLRFTTCYIGNGISEYFAHRNLWSNKNDCCDVRGNVKAVENTSQDIGWETRLRHASNKESAKSAMELELETDRLIETPKEVNKLLETSDFPAWP